MRPDAFKDQVAIITGASSGIGRALALQLAGQGAKVAIAARRTDRLEQVAAECRSLGGVVLVVPTDVTLEEQCRLLVEKTVDTFGRLDMLINNAGLTVVSPFEKFPDLGLFRHILDVNFYGAVHCSYHALPHLKKAAGRLVAVSSLAGKAAIPFNSSYVSSKYALHGFYDALRMELAPAGVSVTVVCPYWVVSEFHEAQLNRRGIPVGPRGRALYTKRTMTSEKCARMTLRAAHARRRELLMGPGWLAGWLKLLAPGFTDWFLVKIFLEPAIRRARSGKIKTT